MCLSSTVFFQLRGQATYIPIKQGREFIGIKGMEVFFRAGGFGNPKAFPAILGSECAGTVLAIGQGVAGFAIGVHERSGFRYRDERP